MSPTVQLVLFVGLGAAAALGAVLLWRKRHIAAWTAAGVGLLLIFVGIRDETELLTALAAFGTVAAAVAAAVAAQSSFTAAAESTRTAERAREALGRALKPELFLGVAGSLRNNEAVLMWGPATDKAVVDGTVKVYMRDGQVHTDAATITVTPGQGTSNRPLPIGSMPTGPGVSIHRDIKRIVAEYTDEYRLCRWRLTREYHPVQHQTDSGGLSPTGRHEAVDTEELLS